MALWKVCGKLPCNVWKANLFTWRWIPCSLHSFTNSSCWYLWVIWRQFFKTTKKWDLLTLDEVPLVEHVEPLHRSQAAGGGGPRYSWTPQLNGASQSWSFPPAPSSSPPWGWRWWSWPRPPPAPPASGWGRGRGSPSPTPSEPDRWLLGTLRHRGLWGQVWRWWRGFFFPTPVLVKSPVRLQRWCRDS